MASLSLIFLIMRYCAVSENLERMITNNYTT